MANPLTGDYAAVLQVSGGTVNRLMASVHQNFGGPPALPSFPHSTTVRLGDDVVVDGVKGRLWTQLGVPRIDLIDGADDRFRLEAGIRARYAPDAGSVPLPEFINGTVSAEYRLEGLDPGCPGWHRLARDQLLFRVVEESVSFQGTAVGGRVPVNEPEAIARITRQLQALLTTRFVPRPQRVSQRFRPGSMRTLNPAPGSSAVVIPVEGAGQPASVDQVVLEGHDFGVALSAQYVLSQVQPVLDHLKASFVQHLHFHSVTSIGIGPFSVDVLTIDIDYTVTLDSATAEWSAGTVFGVSAGLLTVRISGSARTQKSEYDVTFDVVQQVMVTFDAASEGLQLAPAGPPSVDVHAGGLFGGALETFAEPRIRSEVAAQVQTVLSQAAGQFNPASRKVELITLLRQVDDHADAHFSDASFTPDGLVLLGRIPLAPRRMPVVTFQATDQRDGYTAYESWFPGGRIDSFDWSWSWWRASHGPGSESFADRFLLRRPPLEPGGTVGVAYFGGPEIETPLPGLDGWGTVCLRLGGVQVNAYTGELDQVTSDTECTHFDWRVNVIGPEAVGRLLLRDSDHGTETGLLDVGGRAVSGEESNLLVVHAGEHAGGDLARVVEQGLRACERRDAGLVVLVLFPDGAPDEAAAKELRELAGKLPAPLLVSEDVRGAWSGALGVRDGGDQAWRLISPAGGVTWMHNGRIAAEELAKALDSCLFPTPPPTAALVRPLVEVGAELAPGDLVDGGLGECPPPPVGVLGDTRSAVAFVLPGSPASEAQLRHLSREGPVVAVVDGAAADEAGRIASGLGDDVVAIPDPDGAIAARFGVRYWPTTLAVNELGVVTAHQVGLDRAARAKGEAG